ncbi:MAG TPA: uracil-DNA glycosylase, partial [Rudaea sp.]|nr:uracil-DNA glycosylase [Rudaea sp.]
MRPDSIRLDASWKARVGDYFSRPDMQALSEFLRTELRAGKAIYPPPKRIFAALDATPFEAVKVVILGQDPYH